MSSHPSLPAGVTQHHIDALCAEPGSETLSCAYCGATFNELDTDAYHADCGEYFCADSSEKCWQTHQKLRFRGALTSRIIPQIHALREEMYSLAAECDQEDADSIAAMIAFDDWVREEAEGHRSTFRAGITLEVHEYHIVARELYSLATRLQVAREFAERDSGPSSNVAIFATQDQVRLGRVLQLLENADCIASGKPERWDYMHRPSQRAPRIEPQSDAVSADLEVLHG